MPLRHYRCAEGHTTEELFPLDHHPKKLTCLVCGAIADNVPTSASMKLFGGTDKYDVKDVWEGTPLENMGEPSLDAMEHYKSTKEQVDFGVIKSPGARSKQAPGRQWDQAQAAMRQVAEEAVAGL